MSSNEIKFEITEHHGELSVKTCDRAMRSAKMRNTKTAALPSDCGGDYYETFKRVLHL